MANHENLTSLFTDIADSIRAKTGENRVLVADDFPDEIDAIPSGGGGVINPITITSNGTYTAPSGVDGYSPVTVNVSQPGPTPVPPDIRWTRPTNYPDLDSLTYPDDANEMYFTIDRTKGSSSDYSFEIQNDNDNESLTFGHITNGVYVADTENLMAGSSGSKTIDFSGYSSDILLGKFSYSGTSNIQASKIQNKCIIESYVNWTGASNNNGLLFIGENLKYIKFLCYNNTFSSLSIGSTMFGSCRSLQFIDFGNSFNTSNFNSISGMFGSCRSLQSIDLSTFDTSNVTNINSMFSSCYSLQSITFGNNFDTSNVTDMSYMFRDCHSLQTLDLSTFDTSNVTDMRYMFEFCYSLESINFGTKFNTSNVTNMVEMFNYCYSLQTLDLSTFNTSKVTNMNYLFGNCFSLKSIDLSTFTTSNLQYINQLFYYCYSLQYIDFGSNFDISNVYSMNSLFQNCFSLQHQTFINIMNILPVVTTTKTMQFSIPKHKVDPADIAIGTEKGWTITLAS